MTEFRPYMREDEVRAFLVALRSLMPSEVVEFGCGGSTIHFSREPYIRKWIGIEHDRQWFKKVRLRVGENVELRLVEQAAYLDVTDRCDLVFVDGIKRNAVLTLALKLLKPGGRVILHDAGRDYDLSGFESRCWIASPDKARNHQGLMVLKP